MAAAHPSTLLVSKLDFTIPHSPNLTKIHIPSSSTSSNKTRLYDFLISPSNSRHGKENKLLASSLVTGNSSVDDKDKQNIPLVDVKTSDHWRKNIAVLAESHRVFAIDLIGYGNSDKPNPHELGVDSFYTFETWGSQVNDFCRDVVRDEAFFICNSIGGVVGLQASVLEPQLCKGILLLNISLRMLHITKQPWYGRPFIKGFQEVLRKTTLGKFFFKSVATPQAVKSILSHCYYDTTQVTDELVEKILLPGLEPGVVDVFLEFICYSGGPLPEDLLPQVKCPVLVVWGDKDPWEPIELGRSYGNFDTVEDFIALPDVGHCPQDEAPHIVNPIVNSFVARHAKGTIT